MPALFDRCTVAAAAVHLVFKRDKTVHKTTIPVPSSLAQCLRNASAYEIFDYLPDFACTQLNIDRVPLPPSPSPHPPPPPQRRL